MIRNLVCIAVLVAFIVYARRWLTAAFSEWGFWEGMTLCAVLLCLTGLIAFGWDHLERRRSRS